MHVKRLTDSPIIFPGMDDRMGTNINGPSLIRVPEWLPNPLGRYYLYFAHHQGTYIRMAHADHPAGPYSIYSPGTLSIEDTPFQHHIASPDVSIDNNSHRITMLYHGCGCTEKNTTPFSQVTCCARSNDGLSFKSERQYLAESYTRTFPWHEFHYGFSGGPSPETDERVGYSFRARTRPGNRRGSLHGFLAIVLR